MSRLISLYKSLSDDEIARLKEDVVTFKGITFLNSPDDAYLLGLACAERFEDLDCAAAAVSRLGKRCNDSDLNRFDILYTDLKLGNVDFLKVGYGSKMVERKVHKMEKLVSATSCLHAALEALTEMEVAERKLLQWKNRQQAIKMNQAVAVMPNFDLFNQKIEYQRKEVRHFREISLWSKSFDKSVSLMAKLVCIIHARICAVFRKQRDFPLIPNPIEQIIPHSTPNLSAVTPKLVRFYSLKVNDESKEKSVRTNRVFHSAGPSTVGGSGLALRYANVILLAEKYLDSADAINNDSRESFYQMLPENLKALVRMKLSKNMKFAEDDMYLADGWRQAMVDILGWLGPIAHNTVLWQMERNFEKMKFNAKPTVLLLETLHFSDKEKTEAAIVEVLVALSCIYRFENRHLVNED